jgi:hypothetical protein
VPHMSHVILIIDCPEIWDAWTDAIDALAVPVEEISRRLIRLSLFCPGRHRPLSQSRPRRGDSENVSERIFNN